ncbi:MAG: hypothetical protein ACTHU0_26595 [Kofleriaceae bacterium]
MGKNRKAIEKRRQAKKARKSAERCARDSTGGLRTAPTLISTRTGGPLVFSPHYGAMASLETWQERSGRSFGPSPSNEPIRVGREDIERAARQMSDGPIGLVYLRPELWAEPRWCIQNVRKKVELDGGRARYGWTFNIRRGPAGPYITLAHHAVWNAPDGKLIDVTPLDPDPRVRPVMEGGDTLFLFDENAQPVSTRIGLAPLTSHSFPMTDDPELARYIETWNECERRDGAKRYEKANAMTVDPAMLDPRGGVDDAT